jgi:hypothetical protein
MTVKVKNLREQPLLRPPGEVQSPWAELSPERVKGMWAALGSHRLSGKWELFLSQAAFMARLGFKKDDLIGENKPRLMILLDEASKNLRYACGPVSYYIIANGMLRLGLDIKAKVAKDRDAMLHYIDDSARRADSFGLGHAADMFYLLDILRRTGVDDGGRVRQHVGVAREYMDQFPFSRNVNCEILARACVDVHSAGFDLERLLYSGGFADLRAWIAGLAKKNDWYGYAEAATKFKEMGLEEWDEAGEHRAELAAQLLKLDGENTTREFNTMLLYMGELGLLTPNTASRNAAEPQIMPPLKRFGR